MVLDQRESFHNELDGFALLDLKDSAMSLEDPRIGSKRWVLWMDNHDRVLGIPRSELICVLGYQRDVHVSHNLYHRIDIANHADRTALHKLHKCMTAGAMSNKDNVFRSRKLYIVIP